MVKICLYIGWVFVLGIPSCIRWQQSLPDTRCKGCAQCQIPDVQAQILLDSTIAHFDSIENYLLAEDRRPSEYFRYYLQTAKVSSLCVFYNAGERISWKATERLRLSARYLSKHREMISYRDSIEVSAIRCEVLGEDCPLSQSEQALKDKEDAEMWEAIRWYFLRLYFIGWMLFASGCFNKVWRSSRSLITVDPRVTGLVSFFMESLLWPILVFLRFKDALQLVRDEAVIRQYDEHGFQLLTPRQKQILKDAQTKGAHRVAWIREQMRITGQVRKRAFAVAFAYTLLAFLMSKSSFGANMVIGSQGCVSITVLLDTDNCAHLTCELNLPPPWIDTAEKIFFTGYSVIQKSIQNFCDMIFVSTGYWRVPWQPPQMELGM